MSFIQFHSYSQTEVLRLSKDGIWANPDIPVDEAAKLVLAAMEWNIKVLVEKAVADEREACAKACEDDAFVDQWRGLAEAAKRIRARGQA